MNDNRGEGLFLLFASVFCALLLFFGFSIGQKTAADDQQVSGQCADDARLVDGMVGVIQPIGLLADVGQGRQDIGTCDVGEYHGGWLSRA